MDGRPSAFGSGQPALVSDHAPLWGHGPSGFDQAQGEEPTVVALFVESGGCYFGLPGVEPWDEARDARTYAGPLPVVAHPPCQRWGKLWAGQPLWIKRTGERKVKGDDGGCFEAALAAVRRWGGVLEHPWGSHAWPHFGLNRPPREGGWIAADFDGGWTCCVEQGRYGHYARKPTLLLAYRAVLPELDWGIGESRLDPAIIERMGLTRAKRLGEVGGRGGGCDSAPRIGTPEPFRDLLISIARSCDSGSRPEGENPERSGGVEGAARQSGGEAASPKTNLNSPTTTLHKEVTTLEGKQDHA